MKKPVHRFAVATSDPSLHASLKAAIDGSKSASAIVLSRNDSSGFFNATLADEVRNSEANVLILDVGSEDRDRVVDHLHSIAAQMPELRIVLAGQAVSADVLLDLIRAGISDYLPKPIENGSLEAALSRATRGIQDTSSPTVAGRIIGLIGPKGGTGVTTTACNLAIAFQKRTNGDVLLADLNAELGTAALLLGLRPRYNFVELVKNLHRMDEDLLHSYVTKHETGMAFLPSPLTARDLEGVTRQRINGTMAFLKSQYGHLVLDLGNSMTPLAQAGLAMCDEVVCVLTPEVPALRNAKRLMPLIAQALPGGEGTLRFVVNRYDTKVDISLGQIRDTLGRDVRATIPRADAEATHAANVGRPLAMEGPGKYDKALGKLVADLASPGTLDVGKKGRGNALLDRIRTVRPKRSRNGRSTSEAPAGVDDSEAATPESAVPY